MATKTTEHLHLEHTGWLTFPAGDLVAEYIRQGWFEYTETSFLWAYLRKNQQFLDIGAHAGMHAATAGKITGPGGRTVCVEPNEELHALLRDNTGGAEILPIAITAQEGEAGFVVDTPQQSSFGHIAGAEESTMRVRTQTLDSVTAGLTDFDPCLIKVDIEGAEGEFFQGGKDFLAAFDGVIIVEFSKLNLERFDSSTEILEADIRALGFEICVYNGELNVLQVAQLAHPVWYQNFFLCRDVNQVNDILSRAPAANLRIAKDVYGKGVAAEQIHAAAEALTKERRAVLDLCASFRGLHDHIRSDGATPVTSKASATPPEEAVLEMQDLFGVSKAIALHNLSELHRLNGAFRQLLDASNAALDVTRNLERILELDAYDQQQADESSDLSIYALRELDVLTSALANVKDSVEQVIDERNRYQRESGEAQNSLQVAQAELQAVSVNLESSLKQAEEIGQKLADAELQIKRLEEKLIETEDSRNGYKARSAENLERLQERNRYYGELVSIAVNNLAEIRKSRLVGLAGICGFKLAPKIDQTIAQLSC